MAGEMARSDRPRDPSAYTDLEFVADALAVLDATGIRRAVIAGVSMGRSLDGSSCQDFTPTGWPAAVLIDPTTSLTAVPHPKRVMAPFGDVAFDERGMGEVQRALLAQ